MEVFLELLEVLLFDDFNGLDFHLEDLEFLEVGLVDLFELEHLVAHLLLAGVLALSALDEAVDCVDALEFL